MFGIREMSLAMLMLALISCFVRTQTKTVTSSEDTTISTSAGPEEELWSPPGVSREDWVERAGIPLDQWERIKFKLNKLRKDNTIGEECQLYSEDQVDRMLKDAGMEVPGAVGETGEDGEETDVSQDGKPSHQQQRRKRSITTESNKWGNPILYKFDGSHRKPAQETIRQSFLQWEQQTCVRFFEVNKGAYIPFPHLIVTKNSYKCQSFVGNIYKYQSLSLGDECMDPIGRPIHEIGHALGLWHTQQRGDRDKFVRINWDKVEYYHSMFAMMRTEDHSVPYDYGSIMHYPWNAGSYSERQTINAVGNPQYKMSMGQRMEISFYDAKLVNKEYCRYSCLWRPLYGACRNGGYQDPNNCYQCRCPDGFAGKYCDRVAKPINADCGGRIYLIAGQNEVIQSPGYDSPTYYKHNVTCAWHIMAPYGYNVSLHFEGEFGLYCYKFETCYHWVEVKYSRNLGHPGLRYCCYKTPADVITSETNEMLIVMKSNYKTTHTTSQRGFKARVYTNPPGYIPEKAPTPASDETDEAETRKDERWTTWYECSGHSCTCGGCSSRKKYRLCGGEICSYDKVGDVMEEPCDSMCTEKDTIEKYAGRFYQVGCPRCCAGFSPTSDRVGKCVRDTW